MTWHRSTPSDHPFPFLTDGPEGEIEEHVWVPKTDTTDTPEDAVAYALYQVPRDTSPDIFEGLRLVAVDTEHLVPVETVMDDEDEEYELRGPECVTFDEHTRWVRPNDGEPGASEWWRIELVEAAS